MNEKLNMVATADASVIRGGGMLEMIDLRGVYDVWCIRDGVEIWRDSINNVVTTVGKNAMLDAALAGSSYTVTGPYIGLISSVGYTSVPVVGDTMASHSTWNEAGNGSNFPNWSTPASNARATAAWAAASGGAKALSSNASFVIATNGGTVKGCFMVFGSGAVATNNNTSGVLLSAGLFTGGDKVVAVADTLNVSYSLAM